jgi:hypothetical protein
MVEQHDAEVVGRLIDERLGTAVAHGVEVARVELGDPLTVAAPTARPSSPKVTVGANVTSLRSPGDPTQCAALITTFGAISVAVHCGKPSASSRPTVP